LEDGPGTIDIDLTVEDEEENTMSQSGQSFNFSFRLVLFKNVCIIHSLLMHSFLQGSPFVCKGKVIIHKWLKRMMKFLVAQLETMIVGVGLELVLTGVKVRSNSVTPASLYGDLERFTTLKENLNSSFGKERLRPFSIKSGNAVSILLRWPAFINENVLSGVAS